MDDAVSGTRGSIEEARLELLTFYDFPNAMWKPPPRTNTLENLNREF
jgi:transposase-like protein